MSRKHQLLLICILGLAGAVAVWAVLWAVLHGPREVSGHVEAFSELRQCGAPSLLVSLVPPEARDIWYYWGSASGDACFAMGEPQFQVWSSSQGWTLTKVGGGTSFGSSVHMHDQKVRVTITDGYYYTSREGEGGDKYMMVAYDAQTHRAYIWLTFLAR